MAYNGKTNWINNEIVEAVDMNRIEQGITDNDQAIGETKTDLSNHELRVNNPHAVKAEQIPIIDATNLYDSEDVEAALAEVMDEVNAHKAETAKMIKIKTNITVLQTGWVDDTATSGYWLYDVTDTDVTASMAVDVYIHLTSIANSTILLPVNNSDTGKFTLYASSEPTEDITIDYSILNQIGGV